MVNYDKNPRRYASQAKTANPKPISRLVSKIDSLILLNYLFNLLRNYFSHGSSPTALVEVLGLPPYSHKEGLGRRFAVKLDFFKWSLLDFDPFSTRRWELHPNKFSDFIGDKVVRLLRILNPLRNKKSFSRQVKFYPHPAAKGFLKEFLAGLFYRLSDLTDIRSIAGGTFLSSPISG